jgi:hypothetical protein
VETKAAKDIAFYLSQPPPAASPAQTVPPATPRVP